MKAFPADVEFRPVSPQLTTYRQLMNVMSLVGFTVLFTVAALIFNAQVDPNFWHGLSFIPAVWTFLWDVGLMIVTPYQVRIHGWVEQPDDLLIRAGAVFRKYEAIPYGRLQFVEVNQGPLQRKFNLANVTITTAGSNTTIYGVPTQQATRLRDDLTQRGYARLAGL